MAFLVYVGPILLVPLIIVAIEELETYEGTGETPNLPAGSLAWVRQLGGRLPLGTLALIYAIAIISQSLFYVIQVEETFYLDANTGVSSTLTGVALGSLALFAALGHDQWITLRVSRRASQAPVHDLRRGCGRSQ